MVQLAIDIGLMLCARRIPRVAHARPGVAG
jgi:hypothetical protein